MNVHVKIRLCFPLSRDYFVSCLTSSAACLCAVAGVFRVSQQEVSLLSLIEQNFFNLASKCLDYSHSYWRFKWILWVLIKKKKFLILFTVQENCDDRFIDKNHQQSSPSPTFHTTEKRNITIQYNYNKMKNTFHHMPNWHHQKLFRFVSGNLNWITNKGHCLSWSPTSNARIYTSCVQITLCSCYFTNMLARANFMKSSLLLTKCLHFQFENVKSKFAFLVCLLICFLCHFINCWRNFLSENAGQRPEGMFNLTINLSSPFWIFIAALR